ncbi:MAG: hypothetical protein PHW14_04240 [Candidatus Omnitrophica bacterium]|nr:hypothetical protein [Candidatus Omnitrophota bacterium]
MKAIGNILAMIGLFMFVYTLAGRFIGEKSIAGFTQIPGFGQGFTAVGAFSATACVLLLAVLALLNSKD